MTKVYFFGQYNSIYFTRLYLNLLLCSWVYGFTPTEKLLRNGDSSLRNSTKEIRASKTYIHGTLNLNGTVSSLSSPQSQGNQNRTNRDTGFGTFFNNDNSLGSAKPSLWEIFKSNLFPKTPLQVENLPEQNGNSIAHQPQNYFKYNHLENSGKEPEDKQQQDTLAWNGWEKIKSAARKSILISYLLKLSGQNSELKEQTSKATSGKTERHSPVGVELSVDFHQQQKRGKLIHDSLKTFLNVQNTVLNYILGKHGQPLLTTTSQEPTKTPFLHELILKPLSQLVSAHNSINSPRPTVQLQIQKPKPSNDLATAPSEVHWNAWQSYPWKENPKWDPWTFNYHIQRPATEGTVVQFWQKLLWNALRTKKQIITSKAAFLPLLVKIKISALKKVLEKIANKEKSPTFLLLRVIKNALWKGKKAFIRHFLKTKNHVSSFKSKLKYFKHTEPSTTEENSYGIGQDISGVHLTYNSLHSSAPTERYHSAVRPSWSSDSSVYELLPPVVSEEPNYSQTEYKTSSTNKPQTAVVYTSDYRNTGSNSNYGEIVPVPLASENTESFPQSRQVKKNASFSSQLLQLKLNR